MKARGRTRASSPSSRSSRRRCTSGLEAGRSVPVTPRAPPTRSARRSPARTCVEICRALGVESVLVTEDELSEAFRLLYARTKLACEPAARPSTAALLVGKVRSSPARPSSRRLGRQRRRRNRPLLSWLHEGRHPSRVRPRDRDVLLREHVPDAVDASPSSTSRSARTATRSTRASRSSWTRAAGSSASRSASSAPSAPSARG